MAREKEGVITAHLMPRSAKAGRAQVAHPPGREHPGSFSCVWKSTLARTRAECRWNIHLPNNQRVVPPRSMEDGFCLSALFSRFCSTGTRLATFPSRLTRRFRASHSVNGAAGLAKGGGAWA